MNALNMNSFVSNEIKFLSVNFDNTFHYFTRVFKSYPTTWMRKNKFHEQVHIFVGYPPQGRYKSNFFIVYISDARICNCKCELSMTYSLSSLMWRRHDNINKSSNIYCTAV